MARVKAQVGLRLETSTLHKISVIAKKNLRSINSQVEFLVKQEIDRYEKENGPIETEED